jgi:hypothetical protein
MSKALDTQIDATRAKLLKTANTPISMGNYKQQLRAYQEMFLDVINTLDEINRLIDKEVKQEGET